MINTLTRIVISLLIALFIASCSGVETSEEQLETAISQMIYLLEKGDVELFIDQYSYSDLFHNMDDELRTEMINSEEFLDGFRNNMSNKIIKELKNTKDLTPEINTENQTATVTTDNQILNFIKSDDNWRLDIDSIMSSPSVSPFVYTLF